MEQKTPSPVGAEARLQARAPKRRAAIRLIKSDTAFAENSFAKWLREKDPLLIKKTVEAYTKLFESSPFAPDKGVETVIKDLASRRPVPKEFMNRPELFRDSGTLGRVISRP